MSDRPVEAPTVRPNGKPYRRKAGLVAHRANFLDASLTAALARVAELEGKLSAAHPVIQYVSRGRRFVGVEPYPDATARRVNAEIQDVLGSVGTRPDNPDEPTVEIGGQVMTQAQFDAARYPLLSLGPDPTSPGDEMSVSFGPGPHRDGEQP